MVSSEALKSSGWVWLAQGLEAMLVEQALHSPNMQPAFVRMSLDFADSGAFLARPDDVLWYGGAERTIEGARI